MSSFVNSRSRQYHPLCMLGLGLQLLCPLSGQLLHNYGKFEISFAIPKWNATTSSTYLYGICSYKTQAVPSQQKAKTLNHLRSTRVLNAKSSFTHYIRTQLGVKASTNCNCCCIPILKDHHYDKLHINFLVTMHSYYTIKKMLVSTAW